MQPYFMVGKRIADRKFNRITCGGKAQGDVRDTQWDLFIALCGAVGSWLPPAGAHERQLRRIRR